MPVSVPENLTVYLLTCSKTDTITSNDTALDFMRTV